MDKMMQDPPVAVAGPRWRTLDAHRAWLAAEGRALLEFGRGARTECGFGWMDEQGLLLADAPQPLRITARFTHVFALGALWGQPGSADLCDHGVRALLDDFRDRAAGGWFAELREGRPARADKEAYGFAFVTLALSSAAMAGHPDARQGLEEALDLISRRFWREDEGACCESWDAGWTRSEAYRGANANMHMVEAFLAAADATADDLWRQRALRIADRVVNGAARSQGWRIPEHFAADWTPAPDYNTSDRAHRFRPFGITPGHALEWSRLLLSLRSTLADPPAWLLEAARELFGRAVADGWAEPGGFVYTTDLAGTPVIDRRLEWVVAEAIGASSVLQEVCGDPLYELWYRKAWDFMDTHLRDRLCGGWHHELDAALTPSAEIWAGKPDVYHAFQATLIPLIPLAGSLAEGLRAAPR